MICSIKDRDECLHVSLYSQGRMGEVTFASHTIAFTLADAVSDSLLATRFPRRGLLFAEPLMAKQILIADGHEAVRQGLRALLQAIPGWEICGDATDGKEAIAKATELRPDLVILDYAMPGLDGLSAAKQIHEVLPTVPIVLHTRYASTELNLVANKYGIRKVVDKKSGALISAVEELLSSAQP
jgi:CheY-like chemotaxis protein